MDSVDKTIDLMGQIIDAWTKHMQNVSRVRTCDECQDHKIIGAQVKCRQFPGMEDGIACYKFIGNIKYVLRMTYNNISDDEKQTTLNLDGLKQSTIGQVQVKLS